MTSVMRWRMEETFPEIFAVDSANVIEIGDLVYMEVDDVRAAASQADQNTEADNQAKFQNKFAGVAMQQSRNGDTAPIRVATKGVFDYPCASATFEVGDLVGPPEQGNGTQLENQKLVKVPGVTRAIGRVVRREPSATTLIRVMLLSTIVHGGLQSVGTTSSESAP